MSATAATATPSQAVAPRAPTPHAPPAPPSAAASPHQRLLAKQTIIDEWSTREKLFLVSVVSASGGDQNWVSVARTMKGSMAATANPDDPDQARPADWYSQKNCALQYDRMIEKHQRDAPPLSRRTKRTSESGSASANAALTAANAAGGGGGVGTGAVAAAGSGSTGAPDPAQVIAKKLKDERTKELMTLVEHTNRVMANLMEEIDELEDDHISEERLDEIEREMAQEEAEERAQKRAREEDMKERERKKLDLAAALKTGAVAKPLSGAASASVQAAKERRLSEATEAASEAASEAAAKSVAAPATTASPAADKVVAAPTSGGEELEPASTPPKTPVDESGDQQSPLLSLLLQSPSASQSNPSTTPTSPLAPSATGAAPSTPSATQPMSEGLQNMFDQLPGTESRTAEETSTPKAQSPECNGSGESSTLSKLLALPLTDKGHLPDVKELASESNDKEAVSVAPAAVSVTAAPADTEPVSGSQTKEGPGTVKKEEDNEDVDVDVEREPAKEDLTSNESPPDSGKPIPADSSESTEAGPESLNPRATRSQRELEEVLEDRSEKVGDAPKSTPVKEEKSTEDEDKKRLPPPSTTSSVNPTQSVMTTSTSGGSTASTVNTTCASSASDTVTTPSNVRSSKRTTSEKSEDNEEETTGPSRGRRTSKRTSASNPEPGGDEESNPAMPENRRLSRIRGAATGGTSHADDGSSGSRGRRGSGTTSRSSSPTGSEDTVRDESESEPNTPGLVRSTRSRRRSGIRPGLALEESAPSSPASSTPAAVESVSKTEPVAESGASSAGGGLPTAGEGGVTALPTTASTKPSLTSSLTNTTASSSAAPLTTSATTGAGKPFKNQGLLILNNIQTHQFALTFETAMSAKSAPDYANIILRPMDLKTIKSNLEAGTVSNIHEMFRDLSLMLLNATMFSPTGSQTHKDAMAFYRFVQEQMQEVMGAHLLATSTSATSGQTSASPSSSSSSRGGALGLSSGSVSSKMKTKGRREDRKRAAEDTPTSSTTPSSKKRKR